MYLGSHPGTETDINLHKIILLYWLQLVNTTEQVCDSHSSVGESEMMWKVNILWNNHIFKHRDNMF
jgi:hypothetical protein